MFKVLISLFYLSNLWGAAGQKLDCVHTISPIDMKKLLEGQTVHIRGIEFTAKDKENLKKIDLHSDIKLVHFDKALQEEDHLKCFYSYSIGHIKHSLQVIARLPKK